MSEASTLLATNQEFAGLQVANATSAASEAYGLIEGLIRDYALGRADQDDIDPPDPPAFEDQPEVQIDAAGVRSYQPPDASGLMDLQPVDTGALAGSTPITGSGRLSGISIPRNSAAREVVVPRTSGITDVAVPDTSALEGVEVPVPGGVDPFDVGAAPEAPLVVDPLFQGEALAPKKLESTADDAYEVADQASENLRKNIENILDGWLDYHAPSYSTLNGYIDDRLRSVLSGEDGALSDAFEQALYSRMRQRIDAESRAAELQSARSMAKRGYAMPQVVLSAQLAQSATAAADRAAQAATEVAIERAKMELQHLQFVTGMASEARQLLRAQAYQAAAVMVDVYRAGFARGADSGNLTLSEAQANAGNFKAWIDKYGADWQGQTAKAQVFGAQVQAYGARIDGHKANLQAAIDALRADIDAARIGLEKGRALVDADVGVMRASLEKEVAQSRFDIDAARVGLERGVAISTHDIEATKADVQVGVADSQFQVEVNRFNLQRGVELARASVASMEAEVKRNMAEAQFQIEKMKANVAKEVAALESGDAKRAELESANWRAKADADVAVFGHMVSRRAHSLEHKDRKLASDTTLIAKEADLQQQGMIVASQIAGDTVRMASTIASGALSAINGIAHVSEQTNL